MQSLITSSCDLFFQIKQVIITKLREVEIHDLAELVQISSVISLAMDDSTNLNPDVMVSQLINQSIFSCLCLR